jgi:3-hydroxyisobutyrate dehydrogenase-like beta-hydroxyacid dehydrogenase
MAVALAAAGFPLHVWARSPRSLEQLGAIACQRHETIAELAAASEVVALCVGTDDDVFEIVRGGVLGALRAGGIVVNHGTGTPRNAVQLSELCAEAGVIALDAPVSGGRQGAEARRLTTMVGGPESAARRCEPLFRSFSANVVRLGGPGAGQSAKLFNNALLIMNHANIAEIFEAAAAYGLEAGRLAEVLKLGSAASAALSVLGTMVRPENVEHLAGLEALDMEIFAEAMTQAGIDADGIIARGRAGAAALPGVIRHLFPGTGRTDEKGGL